MRRATRRKPTTDYYIFGATGNALGNWPGRTDYEALAEFNEQRADDQELGVSAADPQDLRRRDDLEGSP